MALPLLWSYGSAFSTGLLLAGFALSALGVYLANRYVKKPRPEAVLDKALKPLSDAHRLYHYLAPCDHLLLTPSGLVVLETINLDGEFSYHDRRWKQRFSLNRAFRYIFEPRLGDPIARAKACCQQLQATLAARLPEFGPPPVSALVVFVHPAARLDTGATSIPVLAPKNLHKHLPKGGKKLPAEQYTRTKELLDAAMESKNHRL